jgi:hypothetical protein
MGARDSKLGSRAGSPPPDTLTSTIFPCSFDLGYLSVAMCCFRSCLYFLDLFGMFDDVCMFLWCSGWPVKHIWERYPSRVLVQRMDQW